MCRGAGDEGSNPAVDVTTMVQALDNTHASRAQYGGFWAQYASKEANPVSCRVRHDQ